MPEMTDKKKTYMVLQREYVLLSPEEFRAKWNGVPPREKATHPIIEMDSLAARCGWHVLRVPGDDKFYVEYGFLTPVPWDSFVANALKYGCEGTLRKIMLPVLPGDAAV